MSGSSSHSLRITRPRYSVANYCLFRAKILKKIHPSIQYLTEVSTPSLEEAYFWDDNHADQFDAVCGIWSQH